MLLIELVLALIAKVVAGFGPVPVRGGKLIFHVFAALAEFERDVIRERNQAGLTAARARGRRGGHPRAAALNDTKKVALAQRLYEDKKNSIDDICKTLRVSRSTLYRHVQVKRKV